MISDLNPILSALQTGDLHLQGQFLIGSNYTFMTEVIFNELKLTAVYKPLRGEQPLWDFPPNTLCKREVAAYQVSELLGWELVPPTVFRRKGPLGAGSLQAYVDHDPEYHYFNFTQEDRDRLRPVALFDLLINNADRKGGHILKAQDGHLWLIDHGVCFHEEDKLRSVVWDFAGEPIPPELMSDLCRFVDEQTTASMVAQKVAGMLRPSEIAALMSRARRLVDAGSFPQPLSSHRSYPWPPV
jgi:uncharacterized repeat protein (TIGR03843 family)